MADMCTPEKLVMVAEELLRDDGRQDSTLDDILHALGASIAWAVIREASSPCDIDGASHAVEVSTEAAFDFHDAFRKRVQNAQVTGAALSRPSPPLISHKTARWLSRCRCAYLTHSANRSPSALAGYVWRGQFFGQTSEATHLVSRATSPRTHPLPDPRAWRVYCYRLGRENF